MNEQQKIIKRKWPLLNSKTDAINAIADEFGLRPRPVQMNWFCDSGFWSVPLKRQDRVVEIIEERISKGL